MNDRITVTSCMVCSVDFTYTSHRKQRVHGYSRTGVTAPDVSDPIPLFTNCIVTCVWADGDNRTPSVLFTYNQLFRLDRHPTARRTAAMNRLQEVLTEFAVDGRRVVYAGESKGRRGPIALKALGSFDAFFRCIQTYQKISSFFRMLEIVFLKTARMFCWNWGL